MFSASLGYLAGSCLKTENKQTKNHKYSRQNVKLTWHIRHFHLVSREIFQSFQLIILSFVLQPYDVFHHI